MIYFFFGVLFVYLGIPILQSIEVCIENFCQLIVYYIAEKTAKIKNRIIDEEGQQEIEKNQIGFQTDCIGYRIEEEQPEEQEY